MLYTISMRQLLLGLLMLVMFTPSLVCAMPICNAAVSAKSPLHCAGHMAAQNKKTSGKLTFMSDCMGVDIQKADTANLEKPDLKSEPAVYASADTLAPATITGRETNAISGPPHDWPALSQTQPSILLTTQRLRI